MGSGVSVSIASVYAPRNRIVWRWGFNSADRTRRRDVPILPAADGALRAEDGGKSVSPESAESLDARGELRLLALRQAYAVFDITRSQIRWITISSAPVQASSVVSLDHFGMRGPVFTTLLLCSLAISSVPCSPLLVCSFSLCSMVFAIIIRICGVPLAVSLQCALNASSAPDVTLSTAALYTRSSPHCRWVGSHRHPRCFASYSGVTRPHYSVLSRFVDRFEHVPTS
jgi:hypothetical protein